MKTRFFNAVRSFHSSRKGVAAMEFAIIAPVLMMMLAGATEMSRAYVVKGNLESAAYSVGQVLVALDSTVAVSRDQLIWQKVVPQTIAPLSTEGLQGQVVQVTRIGTSLHVDWLSNAPDGATSVTYQDVVDGLAPGKSAIIVDMSYPLSGGLFGDFLSNQRVHARLVHFQINPL